jgi:ferrous iron transport protein B
MAGSVVLAVLGFFHLTGYFNLLARPITWTLGLPAETGVPLIFGILRKELTLVMLAQALGTTNFAAVMSPVQSFTFAVFVVFYVPCLATLMVLRRELGKRAMLRITALTIVVAMFAALTARAAAMLLVSGVIPALFRPG